MENNGIIDPVNHQLTLSEMELSKFDSFLDNLTDVPSSVPLQPVTVDKVGITSQYAYITIKSPFSDDFVSLYCKISMQVELRGHRGIHMSRCEEALFVLSAKKHKSLDEFAIQLAKLIKAKQKTDKSYVNIEAQYILPRITNKSKKISQDRMTLTVDIVSAGSKISCHLGVRAFNMTGCPCTETFTKFSVVPQLEARGFNFDQINNILKITNSGTHTQRGLVTLVVEKDSLKVTHKSIYEVLKQSCHLVFELLKRPDEHEFVVRVLKKPQFTEDVVREIAVNAISTLKLKDDSRIKAESLLQDSIHIHDVYAKIDQTVKELKAQL